MINIKVVLFDICPDHIKKLQTAITKRGIASNYDLESQAVQLIHEHAVDIVTSHSLPLPDGAVCPLCYLNKISTDHDATCTNPDCQKPKGPIFECWIDKAADAIKTVAHS